MTPGFQAAWKASGGIYFGESIGFGDQPRYESRQDAAPTDIA